MDEDLEDEERVAEAVPAPAPRGSDSLRSRP